MKHLKLQKIISSTPGRSYDVISIFQDGCHKIGNLLPGSSRFRNGTPLRRWISIRIPNFDEISQSTATSSFGKRTAAIFEFYIRFLFLPTFHFRRVILHCAIVGLTFVLKFGLDRIYRFEDIAIFFISAFCLEIAYSKPLWGFWGHISPK